jgi:hypothetical protein
MPVRLFTVVELTEECGLNQTTILRYMKDGSIESDFYWGERPVHLFTESRVRKYKRGEWE